MGFVQQFSPAPDDQGTRLSIGVEQAEHALSIASLPARENTDPEPLFDSEIERCAPAHSLPLIEPQNGLSVSSQEFLQSSSIEELRKAYANRGILFDSEKEFLERVSAEWKILQKLFVKSVRTENLPELLPAITVERNGTQFHIHGVLHSMDMPPEYFAMVNRTLRSCDNWLVEQNLGNFFSAAEVNSVELIDHLAEKRSSAVWFSMRQAYEEIKTTPLSLALGMIGKMAPHWATETINKHRIALANAGKGPAEISQPKFPAYITLELKERSREDLNAIQRRSLYQAAFMQEYAKQFKSSHLHILVGASHVGEVEYFLQHGLPTCDVTNLAKAHVSALGAGKEVYKELRDKAHEECLARVKLGKVLTRFGVMGGALLTAAGGILSSL